ncbi:hypothetical protein [Chitinophaga eiseniae]|uniref:Uncharacterized protein n=1 Tax=Chitinophaga eiseniae TaxID=634771 RepID=A0A847SLM7_9BACT|nr:hypothetical protein [Chitinophaga eiseniae]NLR78049.1 hypothetical protein [Chitinophaga eiseniae]
MDQLTMRSTLLELTKEPYTPKKFVEWLKFYESIPDSALPVTRRSTAENIAGCSSFHKMMHYLHYILLDEEIQITDELYIKKCADMFARAYAASETFFYAYLKQVNAEYHNRERSPDNIGLIELQTLIENL